MAETYEEIVRKHYERMRPKFIALLMNKYKGSKMRIEDAENIYQETFLAIHENLVTGRLRNNTSWNSYIMTIGMRMASKKYRLIGITESADTPSYTDGDEDSQDCLSRRIDDILKDIPDEEPNLYKNKEAQALLGDELSHSPEPCASIIRLTYFGGLTDAEITEELESYNSARAVRSRRWQCMQDLVYRVKMTLYNAGIIGEKPEKKRRNGR